MLLLVLLVLIPVCCGVVPTGSAYVSPGAMAHELFLEADSNHDRNVTLQEMVRLFDRFDYNFDERVTRQEFLRHIQINEPELEAYTSGLFDIFDMDDNNIIELYDFVEFYLVMDPDNDNYVPEYDFVSFFTQVYKSVEHLHPEFPAVG